MESNKLVEQYLTIMTLTITRFTERKTLGITHGPMIMQNGMCVCRSNTIPHEAIYDDRVSLKRWFPFQCVEITHSSSRMRVIYDNWSATKQRPHPQSVAEISRHSVLSEDRIRQCDTSSESRHKDIDRCL